MTIIEKILPYNFVLGRYGKTPIGIVIHIMEGSLVGTDTWFLQSAGTANPVSAHYGVALANGIVHHYVHESNIAFHAGKAMRPTWKLLPSGVDPNSVTIGVEHEGFATGEPWPQQQIETSAQLIAQIAARWNIPIDEDHIIGHWQIDGVYRPNCPAVNNDAQGIVKAIISLAQQVKVEPQVTNPVS